MTLPLTGAVDSLDTCSVTSVVEQSQHLMLNFWTKSILCEAEDTSRTAGWWSCFLADEEEDCELTLRESEDFLLLVELTMKQSSSSSSSSSLLSSDTASHSQIYSSLHLHSNDADHHLHFYLNHWKMVSCDNAVLQHALKQQRDHWWMLRNFWLLGKVFSTRNYDVVNILWCARCHFSAQGAAQFGHTLFFQVSAVT